MKLLGLDKDRILDWSKARHEFIKCVLIGIKANVANKKSLKWRLIISSSLRLCGFLSFSHFLSLLMLCFPFIFYLFTLFSLVFKLLGNNDILSLLVGVLKDVLDLLLVLSLRKTELESDSPPLEFLPVHPIDRLLCVFFLRILQECKASIEIVGVVQRDADGEDLTKL